MLVFTTVDAGVYIDRYEHGERSMRDDFLLFLPHFLWVFTLFLLAFTLFFHCLYPIVPLLLFNRSITFTLLFYCSRLITLPL